MSAEQAAPAGHAATKQKPEQQPKIVQSSVTSDGKPGAGETRRGIDRTPIWPDYFARIGQPDAAN
jgi:hypothetical protein